MINIKKSLLALALKKEDIDFKKAVQLIQEGRIVVPSNNKRSIPKPCAIGEGLTTKVNANIGLSKTSSNISEELKKLDTAIDSGADTIMDLSTGPLSQKLRKKLVHNSAIPIGTVPIYDLACDIKNFNSLKEKDFIDVVLKQAEEGIDFFTIHAGITLELVRLASQGTRIIEIVSRGGALLAGWMYKNQKENPFFTHFDEILKITKKYNITLSLGDSLRPGSIHDATDRLQLGELIVLGGLQKKALDYGVQVMIEGPGHMPLDQIEANVKLEKLICHGAPFYVLGPLVTDAAPGYDHIVSAIGGALAGSAGADFLCYVTPAEHLCLPDIEDVRQGVIASKIAAHASDIVKKIPSALKRDYEISKARGKRDWETQFKLAIDQKLPRLRRSVSKPKGKDVCTMCSDYCSMKIIEDCFKSKKSAK
ncbi:phosphomethylpyrimidine synthase [Candidatus Omnitrophus magneticus]|uniref:Phosphomethylpyrimidine synthase n=1 Tax=Candidatus Omnitrophus magneticus TaxID=1609969 RepID=A0A0F0CQC2_9BACT|nr:phosphomethylpyrimidine synthase [Candidatus Omnitrophus magneticus]